MSDGLSQQASQPPLAGGGGGGSQVPSVISTGVINTGLSVTLTLGPQSTGRLDQRLAQTAALTAPLGSTGRSMTVSQLTGADTISLGTAGRSMTVSQLTGADTISLGTAGRSMAVDSTITGRGFVTAIGTPGGSTIAWTSAANTEADDGANAQWVKSEGLGAGAATTDNGNMRMKNPALGAIPAGFTRTRVEVLVHYNATTVGMAATGDTADHSVDLLDKTGALLKNLINDHFTTNRTTADATVVVDATTSCAGVSDADLALVQINCYAQFARTLAATGTRSFTVNVDSLSLRVTYTRTGIS